MVAWISGGLLHSQGHRVRHWDLLKVPGSFSAICISGRDNRAHQILHVVLCISQAPLQLPQPRPRLDAFQGAAPPWGVAASQGDPPSFPWTPAFPDSLAPLCPPRPPTQASALSVTPELQTSNPGTAPVG